MDQPHPFSPPNLHQQFPLSFFEEDMLLFTGGHQGTPHDLAAWENMGMGQGRSVSSLMDPYTLDLQQATAAATSPTLQSPMDTSTGFNNNNNNGGGGGRTGGKKRGSNVDVLGNPLPLPSSILLSHNTYSPTLSSSSSTNQLERLQRRKSSSSSSSGVLNPSTTTASSININSNSIHNNAILISEAGNMGVFDPNHSLHQLHHHNHHNHNHNHNLNHHNSYHHNNNNNNHIHHSQYHNLNLTTLHYLDTMDMTTNTNVILEEEDEDHHHLSSRSFRDSPHNNQSLDDLRSSNASGGLNQPQKRRRKDTTTTTTTTASTSNNNNNSYGSNTDDLSSNDDDTGSNDGGRRESLVDGKRPERPRLTEEEKKNNHIASEQKRRMAIRDGFDRLTELVPGIEGQGRSESIVLRKTVDHMRKAIEDRRNLIAKVQELGGEVPQDLLLR
ncbi:hypothetical protein AOL_s00080g52 [Orbilia oligospora ATCC 24927]|uniref:BHLH domain-containing protein n=2 Tax=Orbilia oligospora TaxID=2813651 RepID=G1XE17_ARTOA|nr:hypothetical protein AOL_s00080g52 [Orbilia oligospora ATCC 24927]EGX48423.1 hypothetical protein AOL_s00080g52 [Orbilia oligospora ATCC 24927]KAF3276328.1 hypothetical protein TWF970_006290 [Orbilia oligospora]